MSIGLENLSAKEYPGRVIILGVDGSGENSVVVYAITGRSPSSQARKMTAVQDRILVEPTDESVIKRGNIDLLVYPAILISGEGIAVSNGRQTEVIHAFLQGAERAAGVLESSLSGWEYEPDPPTYTPRISGCILPSLPMALSVIKRREDGASQREYFEVPLIPGRGKMISTYTGENRDPLPLWKGAPEDIFLQEKTAKDTAESIYDALRPTEMGWDFRVAVACVFGKDIAKKQYTLSIINRKERKTGYEQNR